MRLVAALGLAAGDYHLVAALGETGEIIPGNPFNLRYAQRAGETASANWHNQEVLNRVVFMAAR
jgi:hypothetical protein